MYMDLQEVTQTVARYVERQTLSANVIDALRMNREFVPNEGSLWDYKRELDHDQSGLAKTVRQVVAFYNTYGGYLIYGVDETSSGSFVPVGTSEVVDQEQLRRKIKRYTGRNIEVCSRCVTATVDDEEYWFNILVIPKRPLEAAHVHFVRDGPERPGKGGSKLFNCGDIYLRDSDETRPANTPDDFMFLGGPRNFASTHAELSVDHNLPDRAQICPRFIGRDEILTTLWEWLGNYLGYAKVLAGAGGLGKSSIAYEFARQVVRDSPYGIEKVIWLTAKTQQFSGETDAYLTVPETHFGDTAGMLAALGDQLSFLDDEIDGSSLEGLQYQLRDAFAEITVLVVVDDVDSLQKDEQRRLMEVTRQLAQENGKFLLTTRENPTFSSDWTIHVPGLSRQEYTEFLDVLNERGQLPKINKEQRKKLFKATDGSPLLTESIVRLVRLGERLDAAIEAWRGEDGEHARDAVLGREVEQLSQESKRVLVAACELASSSNTELSQATGYTRTQIRRAIEELQNLFLLSAPSLIEEEPRFEVSDITIHVVRERANQLVSDYSVLKGAAKRIRSGGGTTGRITKRKRIGRAITQALALLRDGRSDDAVKTIDSELANSKGHPDLLVTRGQCLLADGGKSEEARTAFREAFDKGQRKDLLFRLWYEAEEKAGSAPGMIEVADAALQADPVSEKEYWYGKKARGLLTRAVARSKAGDRVGALNDLREASKLATYTVQGAHGHVKQEAIEDARAINDQYWELASHTGGVHWSGIFDDVIHQIETGDIRTVMYKRLIQALEEWVYEVEHIPRGGRMSNAIEERIAKLRTVLDDRRVKDNQERRFADVYQGLITVERALDARRG